MADARPEFATPAGPGVWRLAVWVQPGARKSEVAGAYQGRLKLKIQAPPVDGKANKAVEKFVASLFGLRPSQVRLENGQSSRSKTLLLESNEEPVWRQGSPGLEDNL